MSRLRQYLERHGIIGPGELQSALQRQQIYGGSLDTCLLELELVDPREIHDMLSRSCGLPSAPHALIESGLERPWASVPAELVDTGWIIPLLVDGPQVMIAVHPDLPDEKLGALYRSVPGMRPMVVPEYCIARLAAERTHSVMPQRYAVLSARLVPSPRPPATPSYPSEPTIPEVGQADLDVQASAEATIPDGMAVDPDLAPSASYVTAVPEPRAVDAHALRNAVAPHRKALAEARERDAATDALTRCAMEVAPRVALFGVKRDGLLALRTPCERIAVPEQTVIPVRDGSDLARVLAGEQVMDRLADLDLRLAMGHESAVPCVFEGIRVRGRSVLMLYVDRDGEAIHPAEAEILREVCVVAGTALEEVLKLRHAQLSAKATHDAAAPEPPPVAPPAEHGPPPTPAREAWKPPSATRQRRAAEERDVPSTQPGQWISPPAPPAAGEPLTLTAPISPEPPPVRSGGTVPGQPTPVHPSFQPPPLHPSDGPSGSEPDSDATVPAPPLEQPAQLQLPPLVGHDEARMPRLVQPETAHRGPTLGPLPGTTPTVAAPPEDRGPETEQRLPGPPPPSHVSEQETDFADVIDDGPKLLTIDASPPPPVLPPPPAAETGGKDRPKTLSGLPPDPYPEPTSSPPPPTQEDAAAPPPPQSQIVSLSSPIAESSPRGRIELDEEDRIAPPRTDADDTRIDQLIDDLRVGNDVVSELVSMGPRGMERLMLRFPGPLEVLRRDLSALPPPSAHGPLLRATIVMADHVVPHLLMLFDNTSPDVRFYAAFVFQELRDGRCMQRLATLAFDPDAEVRIIAMRVLETYSQTPGFDRAAEIVRAKLRGDNRTRQLLAARAVGTLRDVDAIDALIDLLSSKDRFTQEAALESLCSVTGQQHGLKPHRWRQWYVEHGGGHRVEWIVESLRHKDLPVRRWAYDELLRITGHRIEFEPSGDRKEREAASREWMEWWVSEGREQLTAPE